MNFISKRASGEFDNNSLSPSSAHSRWKWAHQDIHDTWQKAICSQHHSGNGFLLSWYRGVESTWLLTMGNAIAWSSCQHLPLPIRAAWDVCRWTTFTYLCTSGSLATLSKTCSITQRHIDTDIVLLLDKNSEPKFLNIFYHEINLLHMNQVNNSIPLYFAITQTLHMWHFFFSFPGFLPSWRYFMQFYVALLRVVHRIKLKHPHLVIQGPLSFRTNATAMWTLMVPACHSLSLSWLHAFVYDASSASYQTLSSQCHVHETLLII